MGMMQERIKQFFTERTAHPMGQFARYLLAGGLGTAIEIALFAVLAWRVFPALREDEWAVRLFHLTIEAISPAQRALNFAACISITFIVSNLAVYFINVCWVFVPGRHSRKKELLLFYGTALFAYLVGTALGSALIAWFGTTGTTAYVSLSAVSILINYVSRKFIIFKG